MARFGSLGTQYFDSNGNPLSGGKIYFYSSGTTTAKDTFTTAGYTVANTNPVILSAGGRQPNIFFNGSAKAILADSNGVQIESRDPVGDTATTAFAAWSSTEIYSSADIVTASDGSYYSSLQNNNINNNPVTPSPTYWAVLNIFSAWSATTNYAQYQIATGTNGNIYYSLAGSNLNHNPVSDTSNTYWIGSVRGPGVAVTDQIATFNGTTGNLIKDSGTLISGLATSGANSNITSLSGLTTPLSIAQGGTNSTATATAGGIGYGTGTAHAYTAAGTLGQILTSAGTSTPTWATAATGSVTSVAATVPTLLSVSGSPITTSGTLAFTYSGTALPTANGGTGQTANFTQYGVVYAPTTTTLGNTGAGTTTTVLHGNAAGAPTYAAVSLTTDVSGTLPIANGGTGSTSTTYVSLTTNVTGTLPVANGGTGATTLTANYVLLGNGSSAPQMIAPSTSGNLLTSNGTTWASTAPAASGISAGLSIALAMVMGF